MALANITKPEATRPIVNPDLTQQEVFRGWIREMTDQVNFNSTEIGTGSPEGVLEAKKGKRYFDEAGAPSSNYYIKQFDDVAGDKTKGWILT